MNVWMLEAMEYSKLLEMSKRYQNGYSDKEGLAQILEKAKEGDYEELVTRCMVVYTLHMGAIGDVATCQSAFQSLCHRYPDSEAARYLKSLSLFPAPCNVCQGVGIIQQTAMGECSQCNNSGKCGRCKGEGKIAWLVLKGLSDPGTKMRCPECRGKGTCNICKGYPDREHVSGKKCPSCNGIVKRVDEVIAKNGLIRATQDLCDTLQSGVECEIALGKALKMEDRTKQIDALSDCLVKYKNAFNIEVVRDTKIALEKEEAELKKKYEILRRHHETLLKEMQNMNSGRAALEAVRDFMEKNPQSPLFEQASLIVIDLQKRILHEANKERRKQLLFEVLVVFAFFALIAWSLSGARIIIRREYKFSGQKDETFPDRFPTKPNARAKCPECGVWLDCPAEVQEEDVVCASCRKTFRVH